ncbi:hypothetical protein ISN44_As04g005270 [Arabidopsis suecica]|jgi:hypothetical protein|uniref:At4g04614 n=3 Tax=Arabidopsis TaxID=3701 RepID=Q1G3K2_ARATH|nr:uncharacterized protein AT4G04614 [Arabidopsis thaliana]NP_001328778.1 uncharacterized protein AT4G04614 [Arabidopsis thaliana]KAG7619634.1 hypothetical protein ISN44_As04g005270 [Arabidopsis suecica]ABF59240.1 unknown protein [Arabidopsis thaliana]ABR46208.1 At4g04614 [Arabidopsis thaliana]AEE82403.1 hypothetical protein AT4G04614 [Arabidopsis thaliana]ANM66912.1 hypothetical protein AT4G04614 [Arabidopsis thaliana]|eukprot:NP_001031583.1 hypothetical protein AT4G04614 [Arabidopsis thaliana]
MKKGLMRWDDDDDDDDEDSSEESSSSSASDSNVDNTEIGEKKKKRKSKKPIARFAKKDKKAFDYESLQQHGYKAVGLSDIPAPMEKQDWSWTTGKDKQRVEEVKESYQEREATRAAAVTGGETIANAQLRNDRKNLSFSQKEKKKRDLGQASRGKNYVEEEKRQLRESGVYSGFDS